MRRPAVAAPTLASLAEALAQVRISSRALVEQALERIADPAGQGAVTFLRVAADQARAAADYHDVMRAHGGALSPHAGIPVSIKDLFDVAGEVTTAGSTILKDAPPAKRDAAAVARLRAAGLIPIGRTNMTEFAFSGIGMNPHYGTPLNPHDRKTGRIPGGSSSGAAVSVTDGMAVAGLGTDTGGSCRIPAAFCGIVGFKPTAARTPREGASPLSTTLDSVGTLASSVDCCAVLDAILAAQARPAAARPDVASLRFAAPQTLVLEDIEPAVMAAFETALKALRDAGAVVDEIALTPLDQLSKINAKGGFPAPEAYAWHRDLIERDAGAYDPRVLARILRGREQTAADYIDLTRQRADLISRVDHETAGYDALLMPTTPMIAPPLAMFNDDATFTRINAMALRNPAVVNFLDGCAISIPCQHAGDAPVGLMICGQRLADRKILGIAAAIERLVGLTL